MAQYFTDFGAGDGYILGDLLAQGWTGRWNLSGVANIIDDAAAGNGRAAEVSGTSSNTNALLSWDVLNSDLDRADYEVLIRTKRDSGAGTVNQGIAGRGSGDGSAPTGYAGWLNSTTAVYYGKFVADNNRTELATASSSITIDEYFYQRFKVSGTNPVNLKAKQWAGVLADEPAAWQIDFNDSDANRIQDAGWIGLFKRSGRTFTYDFIGVGTGADPAPSEPVGGPTPARRRPLIWVPY